MVKLLGLGLALSAVLLPGMRAANVTVGTATARPGEKSAGFIRVPSGGDEATDIPVIVINGAKSGAKLALVAGSHGTESWRLATTIAAAGPLVKDTCR